MLVREIYDLYASLKLLLDNKDIQFPAKVSFAVVRNLRTLEPIVADIEKSRNDLIQKEAIEENGSWRIPKDKVDGVNKQLEDLSETEIGITLLKIRMSDIENMNLSLQEMVSLYDIIEEE